ncbi:MAG: CNNM domain-containing protein [Halosimplex sp.]
MATLPFLVPSVVAVVALVALSAFFSSSESAIFSLPDERIDEAAGSGSPDGVALGELRSDPHRLLVTILVGNNVVNMAISSIVTLLVAQLFSPGVAVVLATTGASAVILVFGEIVPKSYGLGHARAWSLRVARPLALVETVLGPVVDLFDASTRRLTALVGGEHGIEADLVDE